MANDALNELLHLGIESVAEAVCTAMGLYVAGSAGAVGGAAATPLLAKGLKNVLVDVAVRQMSDREKYRVGTAAAHAVNEIYRRLINGDKPRQDGFFESLDDDRSPAETILDGVLTESRQQWEEKKVPWIANIFVNSAFLDVEPLTVYRVITMAERMSWRQFVILSLAARDPDPGLPYSWIRTTPELSPTQEVLRQEILELATGSLPLLKPNSFDLTTMGQLCVQLMELTGLPVPDVRAFFGAE